MRRLGKELGLRLHAAHLLLNLRAKKAFVLGTGSGVGRRRRAHCTPEVSIKFANLTKRIWGLIRAPSLQTRHDQSANWSNPKVDCKLGNESANLAELADWSTESAENFRPFRKLVLTYSRPCVTLTAS